MPSGASGATLHGVMSGLRRLRSAASRLDPVAVDRGLAAVLLAADQVVLWTAPHGRVRLAAAAWSALLFGAVAVRRRWLVEGMIVATLGTGAGLIVFGSGVLHGPSGLIGSVAALLLFYGGGAFLEDWRSVLALALGLTITAMIAASSSNQVVANLLWDGAVLGLAPWFVGRTVRERSARASAARERAERLDAEHEHHARAAALGERARLAREIHDVIAHSVSVMVIQAAGARRVMDREPERAEASLRAVERAGRDALAEMRRLLGVLGDGRDLRALAPQPSLDDLEELVARTRAAGVAASIRVEGRPSTVSPGLSLCVYRVVQEALTNTIKHAGPVPASVSVRWLHEMLELEVFDEGPRERGARLDSGGHGIAGMRERVALHGGTLEAGPAPDGGFAVRARIPLLERQAA